MQALDFQDAHDLSKEYIEQAVIFTTTLFDDTRSERESKSYALKEEFCNEKDILKVPNKRLRKRSREEEEEIVIDPFEELRQDKDLEHKVIIYLTINDTKRNLDPPFASTPLINDGFRWKDYPRLEQILHGATKEYFGFARKGYSRSREAFCSKLAQDIREAAMRLGYTIHKDIDDVKLRTRIRKYYKAATRRTKNRLKIQEEEELYEDITEVLAVIRKNEAFANYWMNGKKLKQTSLSKASNGERNNVREISTLPGHKFPCIMNHARGTMASKKRNSRNILPDIRIHNPPHTPSPIFMSRDGFEDAKPPALKPFQAPCEIGNMVEEVEILSPLKPQYDEADLLDDLKARFTDCTGVGQGSKRRAKPEMAVTKDKLKAPPMDPTIHTPGPVLQCEGPEDNPDPLTPRESSKLWRVYKSTESLRLTSCNNTDNRILENVRALQTILLVRLAAGTYRSAILACHNELFHLYTQAKRLLLSIPANKTQLIELRESVAGAWCIYARVLVQLDTITDIERSGEMHRRDAFTRHAVLTLFLALDCVLAGNHAWISLALSRLLPKFKFADGQLACAITCSTKLCQDAIDRAHGHLHQPRLTIEGAFDDLVKLTNHSMSVLNGNAENTPNESLQQSFEEILKLPRFLGEKELSKYVFVDKESVVVLCKELNHLSRCQNGEVDGDVPPSELDKVPFFKGV